MRIDCTPCTTQHKTKSCVIIANGDRPDQEAARHYAEQTDLLLAADGGARHALALGLTPHVVIGDLDSLTEKEQIQLRADGAHIIVRPADKDETDLELALLYAVEQDADSVVVLGALGGRLDQTLANILLLTMPALVGRDVCLVAGPQTAFIVHDTATLSGELGDTVSLIPLGGAAHGVTTEGLRWSLSGDTVPFGPALGISNEMIAPQARVQVRDGLLFCVHLSHECETLKESNCSARPLFVHREPRRKRRFTEKQ